MTVTMMRSFLLASFFLFASPALAAEELNPTTFEALMSSGKNGMIKFYQPWCGHCTSMKPAWDRLAEEVDKSVFIADVNCSDEEELCKENEVQGYPTIKVYKDGAKPEPYNGGRSFEELFQFVDESLAEKCNVLDDAKRTETCDDKSQKYYAKWLPKAGDQQQKELKRLEGMLDKSMTADLKKWLRQRVSILKQLGKPSDDKAEL